jgi:solute carrier family 12 sodium/potassium/chloride transporter 2
LSVGKKKFGAFGGVFTPSLLTILGVIMYLRLGWVVGHAGLWGALIIVLIAHIISITTGLSISSIATDKKVGAGGVYYVLSRSLGLPIGGAIGLTLFIGTALSIALYIVGFSESFNDLIGIESTLNNIRLTGSVALLILTIIAFISTSLAIKAQYFILAAIFISLGAIIFGVPVPADAIPVNTAPTPSLPMATIFAIFFPAVTGFTAGIAMSGDLKDPKKAIPLGTISAIGVGFIVYVGLVIFLYFKVDAELLKTDYRILERISIFAPAVVAGIWGATLSSALGGILGGPRILQAMSLDKITPMIFGKEQGKSSMHGSMASHHF